MVAHGSTTSEAHGDAVSAAAHATASSRMNHDAHGDAVSAVARVRTVTGEAHGDAVSAAARAK
jgi:hypothetical protein